MPTSYASAVRDRGGSPGPPGFRLPRVGALRLEVPPGKIDGNKIALALDKQCAHPEHWQPIFEHGDVFLQCLVPGEPSKADKIKMLEKGLAIGNASVTVKEVVADTTGKELLFGRIEGVTMLDEVFQYLKQEFGRRGSVVHFEARCYGKTKVKTGIIDWILDVTDTHQGPNRVYYYDTGAERVVATVHVLGRRRFCYYCRSTDHLRKDCKTAPHCKFCNSQAHPPQHCPTLDETPPVGVATTANTAKTAASAAAPAVDKQQATNTVETVAAPTAAASTNEAQLPAPAAPPSATVASNQQAPSPVAQTQVVQEADDSMAVDDDATEHSSVDGRLSEPLSLQRANTGAGDDEIACGVDGFPTMSSNFNTTKKQSAAEPAESIAKKAKGAGRPASTAASRDAAPYHRRRESRSNIPL